MQGMYHGRVHGARARETDGRTNETHTVKNTVEFEKFTGENGRLKLEFTD